MAEPTKIELLELDIDLRLVQIWTEVEDVDEWDLGVVASLIRAAYGKGYIDALSEEKRGLLCQEHGYEVPAPR